MSTAQNTPAVTVIIATYNSSATLKLALQSLLKQDFSDFEAWVVGDACTDDSEEVVASCGDPRLHWTNLPRNSGSQGAPNNEGLRQARGRYIAYLNHDDLWFPWHLSGLMACIQETGADLVHSLGALFGPKGLVEETVRPLGVDLTHENSAPQNSAPPPSSWLHRRQIVEEWGLWEEDPTRLSWGIDSDYFRRIYLAGKRIEFCPQLSVLIFPAWWFGLYTLKKDHPQVSYFQALQNDPEKLYRQTLLNLVLLSANRRDSGVTVSQAFRPTCRLLLRRLLDVYGRERWPLAPLLYWRYQRHRRWNRRQRGLTQ